ncbi:MAG TPA: ATP phosphoribosyltransferase [Anaerolineae bacterium]|nr:ATP phosphoribosyltransferase [Anaerolineae bacterium]
MHPDRTDIRLALPSKGRLADDALGFLAEAGLRVYKPNPRQYEAVIPTLPGLTVLFQRAGDIAVSVRDGSVDFGVTGWDAVCERRGDNGDLLPLHGELGFGHCALHVIVPEALEAVRAMSDLSAYRARLERPLRVATKFPRLTAAFFARHALGDARLIDAEGTLEVAPAIGYADLIVDLVSTGTTLRDNRLRTLVDGLIVESQACLIGNRRTLKTRSEVLAMARLLLEFIEAHLRAAATVSIFANMRGESPQAIAARMFEQSVIGGLQGPTIAPVVTRQGGGWYDVHIIVRRDQLTQAIAELRAIGGSGVVVTPVTYIFEEEPAAYQAMLAALQ